VTTYIVVCWRVLFARFNCSMSNDVKLVMSLTCTELPNTILWCKHLIYIETCHAQLTHFWEQSTFLWYTLVINLCIKFTVLNDSLKFSWSYSIKCVFNLLFYVKKNTMCVLNDWWGHAGICACACLLPFLRHFAHARRHSRARVWLCECVQRNQMN
jgi:hypothetical protein